MHKLVLLALLMVFASPASVRAFPASGGVWSEIAEFPYTERPAVAVDQMVTISPEARSWYLAERPKITVPLDVFVRKYLGEYSETRRKGIIAEVRKLGYDKSGLLSENIEVLTNKALAEKVERNEMDAAALAKYRTVMRIGTVCDFLGFGPGKVARDKTYSPSERSLARLNPAYLAPDGKSLIAYQFVHASGAAFYELPACRNPCGTAARPPAQVAQPAPAPTVAPPPPPMPPAPTVQPTPEPLVGVCPDVYTLKVNVWERAAFLLPGVERTHAREEFEGKFVSARVSRTHGKQFREAYADGTLRRSHTARAFRVSFIMTPEAHGGSPTVSREEFVRDVTVAGLAELQFTRAQLQAWDAIRVVAKHGDVVSPPKYTKTGLRELRFFNRLPGRSFGEWDDNPVPDCVMNEHWIE